jgi:hypothetical protein
LTEMACSSFSDRASCSRRPMRSSSVTSTCGRSSVHTWRASPFGSAASSARARAHPGLVAELCGCADLELVK